MKPLARKLSSTLPIVAVAALAILAACEKKSGTPAATAALNPESAKTFDATGAYLDMGGDFYLYLRTEEVLARVPAEMDEWKKSVMDALGKDLPVPAEQIDAWYSVVRQTVIDSGLTQVRAVGMSALDLEPGLSRIKFAAYSGALEKPGLLWRLGGRNAPHPFDSLDFLPATTVYAGFSDFDPQTLWAFVQQVLKGIPDKSLQQQADAFPKIAENVLGMPLADLFSSIDSEFGFVITADETATMKLPIGGKPMEMPRAEAALLIRVKDDRLYNLLIKQIDATVGIMMPFKKSEANGVKMATAQVPVKGLPLAPTVARFGNYVAISTTDTLVQQLARTGTPPPLMKDTPEFQRFAKLEKMEGNSFGYLSERGASIVRNLQVQSVTSKPGFPPALKPGIEKLYGLLTQKFVFSIGRVEKDGYSCVSYSSNGGEQIVLAAAILPTAIVAAMAIPAIDNAQRQADATRCLAEMRALDAAIAAYKLDHAVADGTVIAPADLAPYLSINSASGKRARAVPFVDSLGNPYPDFIAGQQIHISAATAAKFPRQTKNGFWGIYTP